jgi:molybdopterin-guanine dinucleotide biosynthesis protein A
MNRKEKISCAVLAGGKGKRLNGENKALLKIGERDNLSNIIDLSQDLFDEILLITNQPEKYIEFTEFKIYTDIIREVGPLGGIHSALTHSTNETVFFLPCDMPFLSSDLIRKEIRAFSEHHCDVLIPRMGELIEPLHSIFKVELKDELEKHIKSTSNFAIRHFFDKADVFYWDIDDNDQNRKAFFNINTHHDLDKARIEYERGK